MAVKFDFALTDAYTSRITDLNDTYKALAKCDLAGTEDGIPTNAKRWNGTTNKFEIWNGASWSTLSNIPYLDTANTFTANQNITGNLSITGNVGIGASSDGSMLYIEKGTTPTIKLVRTDSDPDTILSISSSVYIGALVSNKGLYLYSGDTQTLKLEDDNSAEFLGNVGIGGSPDQKLSLIESGATACWTRFENSNHSVAGALMGVDSTGDIGIRSFDIDKKIYFQTSGTNRFEITSDGKLSTGGETSPDVLAGGIHIKGPSTGTGNLLKAVYDGSEKFTVSHLGGISGNSLNISNGIVASFVSTTEWDCGEYSEFTGDNTVDTTESTGSSGYMIMDLTKTSPIPPRDFDSDDNLFVIKNNGSTKHIFKGGGDIYTDTGTVTAYDVEDDIMLVETVRNSFYNKKVLKHYKTRLEELGIMKNGFMSHNKMHSLHLGAIGQMWNIIKALGKELGYDDKQLLEFSKHY